MECGDQEDGIPMRMRNNINHDDGIEPLLQAMLSSYDTSAHSFDCILVAHEVKNEDDPKFRKQAAYIRELKKKDMKVTVIHHDKKVFYGIRAPDAIFIKYKYLLRVSDSCNWTAECRDSTQNTTRIRVVSYILHHTWIENGEKLRDLIRGNVFETLFCLHENIEQDNLTRKWAGCSSLKHLISQPIDDVRNYFGEKVALYFLWLGWYTRMLVPAAIIGLVVFLYALFLFDSNKLIQEVCESNVTMCPRCDKWCPVWKLSDTCFYAKLSHLFDNEGTVAFAMFMAVWATLFLEIWKRHRSKYVSKWKLFEWSEEEEELILETMNDPDCLTKEYKHSYLKSTIVLLLVTLMMVVIIGLTQALVIFRVISTIMLSESKLKFLEDNSKMIGMVLGAVLHYFTIQIMTRVNRFMALKLCDIEKTRSFAATERSFTVKMFTFQFFTLFSSLIYVAFFLGRINGYPGHYVRIAGKWRQEECHPSGCLTDLFIQMAIILLLKQTISNISEIAKPWLNLFCRTRVFKKQLKECGSCRHSKCKVGGHGDELCNACNLKDWLKNYHLNSVNEFSLFNEFLEMVIQFSFTTIFVAAFPLAPFFALLNNLFEIRLDAYKMLSLEQRHVPKRTNNIGVWYKVLEAVGVAAVIANGLVIGISSEFVPRLVYRYRFGPCANGTNIDGQCMTGYTDYTLTMAYMSDKNVYRDFEYNPMISDGLNVTQCSYKTYRNADDHSLASQYWVVLAARFAFVILFEHVVVVCKFLVAWFVPDHPINVKNARLCDKKRRLKQELKELNARMDEFNARIEECYNLQTPNMV